MTPQDVVGHMSRILAEEKIPFEEGALRVLAQGAV